MGDELIGGWPGPFSNSTIHFNLLFRMGRLIELWMLTGCGPPAIIQKFYFWFDGRLLNGRKIIGMKWKLFWWNEAKTALALTAAPQKQTLFHQTKQINSLPSIQSKKFDWLICELVLFDWKKEFVCGAGSQPTNHKTNKFMALNEFVIVLLVLLVASGAPNSFFNPQSIKLLLHLSSFIS